jgi:aspartate/methionine/tyrosine aminotransferase
VDAFCQNVLAEQGVVLVPASLFDYPGDHFRLGLGRRNFAEALERLDLNLRTSVRFQQEL